ncbi:hypothetical protein [Paenarthrobacter nitroguajacolicus]|uniref:hypothetical protein n=1 Tax=Paenarthrobacter nitroguajacolicus TaxID=211146 RepID=UPI002856F1CF|nr:hypothetical protein [Paenarthrobacter nitroguajacolicus]MDR6639052.1 hypothetical protein [Paenarthrobacter nitroguajacolicus]
MYSVLFEQVVHTDYGQFDLTWGEEFADGVGFNGIFEQFFKGQVNGLIGASDPAGLYVHFGRRSGGSSLRIILMEERPPDATDDALWEDIVEVSFTLPAGRKLKWSSWAAETSGTLDAILPGTYRLRASEKGRDEGAEGEFTEQLLDWYLLEIWPEPPRPDQILRSMSIDGQYWHRTLGEQHSKP